MKHATIKFGEYEIPLIGLPPSSTEEDCQQCKKRFHLQEIELVHTKFLCNECKK